MAYSTSYLIRQMSRGRPLPQGRPEDHLHAAIQRLNHHDVEEALRMGARPGLGTLKLLLDSLDRMGRRESRRAVWCLGALCRMGQVMAPPRALGAYLERAGQAMPLHPQDQFRWWQCWEKISRMNPHAWTLPGQSGRAPVETWMENAADPIQKAIGQRFPKATQASPRPKQHRP